MSTKWLPAEMPDQSGRIAVVTGANSGLGRIVARELAARGANLVLACRDEAKGRSTAKEIKAARPAAKIEVAALDLADLSSVRSFSERFRAGHDRLDLLVNNAGIMAAPYARTADGFELQLGTNHLGHFALTGLLLGALKEQPGARVVTVSSMAHLGGLIEFSDLTGERHYSRWRAYAQSKLANLLFAFELARRLEAARSNAASVAAHPGWAATNRPSAARWNRMKASSAISRRTSRVQMPAANPGVVLRAEAARLHHTERQRVAQREHAGRGGGWREVVGAGFLGGGGVQDHVGAAGERGSLVARQRDERRARALDGWQQAQDFF